MGEPARPLPIGAESAELLGTMAGGGQWFGFALGVYLLTGIMQPSLTDLVNINGGGGRVRAR